MASSNLPKSLSHWQKWEIEYEALKEEILAVEPKPNGAELARLLGDYRSDMIPKKELTEMLGASTTRTADQVVNLLERRIEYVQQNISTLEKQIASAEVKAAAPSTGTAPEMINGDGFPITEIIEELDDDGNIMSSRTSEPGSTSSQLLEVLRKAVTKDVVNSKRNVDSDIDTNRITLLEASSSCDVDKTFAKTQQLEETMNKASSTPYRPSKVHVPRVDEIGDALFDTELSEKGNDDQSGLTNTSKKSVTFAKDTKPGSETQISATAKRVQEIMRVSHGQTGTLAEAPLLPKNESPEDAALRREMLDYAMSEVGAVVAELTLEEGTDWSDKDCDESESTSEEDDEYGRSTKSTVDEDYRRSMVELQQRVNLQMQNIGKDAQSFKTYTETGGAVQPHIQAASNLSDDASDRVSELQANPKSVRFADNLDIFSGGKDVEDLEASIQKQSVRAAPIRDIIERHVLEPMATSNIIPQKQQSRWKPNGAAFPQAPERCISPSQSTSNSRPSPSVACERTFMHPPVSGPEFAMPTGPEGRTLAPKVVERDLPAGMVVIEPDEFDPHLLYQEAAVEHNRRRNLIQQQRGIMEEISNDDVWSSGPDGNTRKMSRFKAARLGRL